MKKIWVLIVVLIILDLNYSVQAQEVKDDSSAFVREKSFDFYFVNGYAVGYEFNLNENSKVKFVLDFKGTYLNQDRSETDFRPEYSEKRDNINLAFYAAYCYSIYKNPYVDIYLGIGPYYNLNFYSNKGTEFVKDTLQTIFRNYSSNSYNAFGASTIFGVEGFINSHISLIAEAQLTGLYRWEKYYSENTRTAQGTEVNRSQYEAKINSWFWEINFARLGIGIYF